MHQLRIIETVRDQDCEDVEVLEDNVIDVEPDEYDIEDGVTAVDLAFKRLDEYGACQPNDTHNAPRWFNSVDPDIDKYTGEVTEVSVHLIGFTEQEAIELREKIK